VKMALLKEGHRPVILGLIFLLSIIRYVTITWRLGNGKWMNKSESGERAWIPDQNNVNEMDSEDSLQLQLLPKLNQLQEVESEDGGEEDAWVPDQNDVNEEESENAWIFYNGIPKSGTSSLRLSVFDTGHFDIKDITSWGCKSTVADNWRKVYQEDLLSKLSNHTPFEPSFVRVVAPKFDNGQNQSRSVFATGHACWVNFTRFDKQPISIQTVRNPTSRWRSAFNYGISGKRSDDKKLISRKILADLLDLEDPFSPEITYDNCIKNDRCFSGWLLNTALAERTAFTPCEVCSDTFRPKKDDKPYSNIRGITPSRNELLATIRLMMTQYDVLIPMEDMASGLKIIQHKWPAVFPNISDLESHARSSNRSDIKKNIRDRDTSVDEVMAERGGFLLTYKVACAKFCLETNLISLQTDFCKKFVDSFGTTLYSGDAVVSPVVNNKYLLWTTPMKGGLHNQLMILTHLGELASQLNRTLVAPQLLHNFPRDKNFLNSYGEMDDIYNVTHLHQNGFTSDLISFHKVPAGLFLESTEIVDLDWKLERTIVDEMKEETRKILQMHSEKQILIVKRDNTQNFANMKISRFYNSFKLSDRLSYALDDCLRFILGIPPETPLTAQGGDDDTWRSLIFLHARVERDWLQWSKKKYSKSEQPFIEYYTNITQIKEKVRESTNVLLNTTTVAAATTPTILVSYAVGELANGVTPDEMKNGWPKEFRVVTSDDLESSVMERYTYLEKSAILSKIAFQSKVMIGNHYSSFSRTISEARKGAYKGITFMYNTKDDGVMQL